MPIIDISEQAEAEESKVQFSPPGFEDKKGRFFSSLTVRVLFFLLLIGDLVWAVWTMAKMGLFFLLFLLTLGQSVRIQHSLSKCWTSMKRSTVCGISLVVALFSPALGIMLACTYFLMYDKLGVREFVPRSLHDHFQEFLQESK